MADNSPSSSSNHPHQPEIPGLDPNEQRPAEVPAGRDPATAPPDDAAVRASSRAERPSKVNNALGNLILLIILICLISIPFLIYFTDTPARLKRNMRQLGQALNGDEPKVVERIVEKKVIVEVPAETPGKEETEDQPEPEPVDAPAPVLPRKEYDVAKLFNGLNIETTLDLQKGETASVERERDAAYQYEIKLKINVPEANDELGELAKLNPNLPGILPDLGKMLETGEVSTFYHKLYQRKHEEIKENLTRLDSLETRHNYFDCESILELTHPETQKKVLLMQGEMDVVADGSDGDRMPVLDEYISLSTYYQPTTSYGWSKKTKTPNPLLDRVTDQLQKYKDEYAIKGLSAQRNRYLRGRIEYYERLVEDLKRRSFLIAEADPFIVLPLSLIGEDGSHAPAIGDYAVVIHGDKVYPAICGDAGPSWKMGEASLFVAKTINENASPYSRPVSDLKVTYLVFPDSADEKKDAPDLEKWEAKCRELLEGIGGLGKDYELYDWRNLIAEREALRKTRELSKEIGSLHTSARNAAQAARKAAESAKSKASAAGKALQEAKSGAATGTDIAALQKKANAAAAASEEVQKLAKEAGQAADRVSGAVKSIQAAVKRAEKAASLPLSAPKEKTTDVVLAAHAEAKKAFDSASADVQLAVEARTKAEAALP